VKIQGAIRWQVDWASKSVWNRQKGSNLWRVGIDGAYRIQPDPDAKGEILALRANWKDADTLILQAQYPTGGMVWEYQMQISGDTLSVELNDNETFSAQLTGKR
jgi:hypothetical protein